MLGRRRHRVALCAVTTSGDGAGEAHLLQAPTNLAQRAADTASGFVGVVAGATTAVGQSATESARAVRFWSSVLSIWARFKMTQVRAAATRADDDERRALWEYRHAAEADAMWKLCIDMRGFYVKAGQLIALQAFVPNVIRERLARLQDDMPPMERQLARRVVEAELNSLGLTTAKVFSSLSLDSTLGSASIAQVHRGRLRNSGDTVAVKLQYPGGERQMTADLSNFQFLAALLQRSELAFDLVSPVCELRKQIALEFDFRQEARAMAEIRHALRDIRFVRVPRAYDAFSTRRMLVMEYLDGTPLSTFESKYRHLPKRMRTKVANVVLKKMARCYGEMVLSHGLFHADCHPGNILVTNRQVDIALLDFGQTKRFDAASRVAFAGMVRAIAHKDPKCVEQAMHDLGISYAPVPLADGAVAPTRKLTGAEMLAYTMFDTCEVTGVSNNPFADDSALRVVEVNSFPPHLFFLLRTVQIFKGICEASGNSTFSLMREWEPIARRVLREGKRSRRR